LSGCEGEREIRLDENALMFESVADDDCSFRGGILLLYTTEIQRMVAPSISEA
jgi:hypothetical protein